MHLRRTSIIVTIFFSSNLHAAYQPEPPKAIIQNRPQSQRGLVTVDSEIHAQMDVIDKQIDDLLNSRSELNSKAETAGTSAQQVMDEAIRRNHELLDEQQKYQQQMQRIDGDIQELVKKKAKLADQLKK